jgi:hypothetical protein
MHCNLKIAVMAITCFVLASTVSAAIPAGYKGKPYPGDTLLGKPQGIPGVVKGMFTDTGSGGPNLSLQGYSDWDYDVIGYGTNGLPDSSCTATHPTSHLSYMYGGLWIKYTVHVNTAGTYYVDFKLANVNAPPNLITLTYYNGAKVQMDSVKDLPMVVAVVPPPGGVTEIWHNWTVNMNVDSVALDTGLQVFQITFVQGAWNYDWMRFRLKGSDATQAPVLLRPQAGHMGLRAALSGNRLMLSYNAGTAATTRISLVDCAGKTVLSSLDETSAAGTRTAGFNVRNLHHGVYFVNVECGSVRETQSITITH